MNCLASPIMSTSFLAPPFVAWSSFVPLSAQRTLPCDDVIAVTTPLSDQNEDATYSHVCCFQNL